MNTKITQLFAPDLMNTKPTICTWFDYYETNYLHRIFFNGYETHIAWSKYTLNAGTQCIKIIPD
jgi:hypothetical protein